MNEDDKAKAIERANSYRQMMDNWAWKDFQKLMDGTRQEALERTIWATSMEDIQEKRGWVKCIDSLNSEISSILAGV